MDGKLEFNAAKNRYEEFFDGEIVYANVRKTDDIVYIDYVEASPALRGTGASGKFMTHFMDAIRGEGKKAKPICGYAASWLRKHKDEYGDLTV